jgi:predicted small lipoprotein YifL
MLMKKAVSAAVLAASIVLALSGCGDKSPANADASAEAASEQLDAQQSLTVKLNDYIDCYNSMDANLHRGIALYTDWIKDVKAGPTGRESSAYGPTVVDDFRLKQCDESVARALAAEPKLPALDAAATDYLAQLHALAPLAKEAHDYYDREDFQDDAFAKGKQIHAPLMAALTAFVTASATFSDALEKQNDQAQREQLAALEKAEGRTLEFYRLSMMLEAKRLVEVMGEDGFDVADATERVAAFNAISDEAHAKVKPAQTDTKWSTFEMSAEQFRRESKERLARVRDKAPYSKMETQWLDHPTLAPSGSPLRLLNRYNDLVQRSNLL